VRTANVLVRLLIHGLVAVVDIELIRQVYDKGVFSSVALLDVLSTVRLFQEADQFCYNERTYISWPFSLNACLSCASASVMAPILRVMRKVKKSFLKTVNP